MNSMSIKAEQSARPPFSGSMQVCQFKVIVEAQSDGPHLPWWSEFLSIIEFCLLTSANDTSYFKLVFSLAELLYFKDNSCFAWQK